MIDDSWIDSSFSNCCCHMQVKHENSDNIHECGHGHRCMRFQHTGRNDCCNRIGRIMKAVHKIKNQSQSDKENDGVETNVNGVHEW